MTQHRILLPLVNAALILAQAVPASAQSPGPDLIARHGAAVTELVRRQIAEQPGARDQERIALVGDLLKRRPDIAGARAVEPIDRRTAVAAGLGNNLRLAIGLTTPERAAALSREADAVFNPVLDLTIGYGRADTEHRTRIGKAITKAVNADGFNINSPFKNLPPSEKLSGVTLTMPMTCGVMDGAAV